MVGTAQMKQTYVRFRVYPNDRGYPGNRHGRYYEVAIFKNRELMWEYNKIFGKTIGAHFRHDRFEAECIRADYSRYPQKLGQLLFYKGHLGAGLVAHEINHAVILATPKSQRRIFTNEKHDERFCRIVESMNAQFWAAYFRRFKR